MLVIKYEEDQTYKCERGNLDKRFCGLRHVASIFVLLNAYDIMYFKLYFKQDKYKCKQLI